MASPQKGDFALPPQYLCDKNLREHKVRMIHQPDTQTQGTEKGAFSAENAPDATL